MIVRAVIVIPVFNGAKTIARAVESTLGQHFDGSFEIIVVNDGSTDITDQILARYYGRIRVVNQPNRGPAAARNAGVALSNADYVAFLDADDSFMPDKLARAVAKLETCNKAVMLFHDAVAVNHDGREAIKPFVTPSTAHAPSMNEMLTRWWPIVPSTAVIRRNTFDACGGFDEEFKSAAYEDPYLWIRAREHGEFIYLPEQLAYYTTSGTGERAEKYLHSQSIFIRRIEKRYGRAARQLIRNTRHSYANAMGYEGLLAMHAGDHSAARRYFMLALRHEPASIKSALRLLRTFLPSRIVRALSGRGASSKCF